VLAAKNFVLMLIERGDSVGCFSIGELGDPCEICRLVHVKRDDYVGVAGRRARSLARTLHGEHDRN